MLAYLRTCIITYVYAYLYNYYVYVHRYVCMCVHTYVRVYVYLLMRQLIYVIFVCTYVDTYVAYNAVQYILMVIFQYKHQRSIENSNTYVNTKKSREKKDLRKQDLCKQVQNCL